MYASNQKERENVISNNVSIITNFELNLLENKSHYNYFTLFALQ